MSDLIEDLVPDVAIKCRSFLARCAGEGLLLRVTQTLRSYDEQNAIYAQGRTAPGPIVTHAPAGYSWHCHARAFDVCQRGIDPYPESEPFWQKVASIGESCGLESGVRWKHPDRPHLQDTGGLTLAQAMAEHDARLA